MQDADHLDTVENSPLAEKVKRAVNKEIQSATDSKEQNLKVRVSLLFCNQVIISIFSFCSGIIIHQKC